MAAPKSRKNTWAGKLCTWLETAAPDHTFQIETITYPKDPDSLIHVDDYCSDLPYADRRDRVYGTLAHQDLLTCENLCPKCGTTQPRNLPTLTLLGDCYEAQRLSDRGPTKDDVKSVTTFIKTMTKLHTVLTNAATRSHPKPLKDLAATATARAQATIAHQQTQVTANPDASALEAAILKKLKVKYRGDTTPILILLALRAGTDGDLWKAAEAQWTVYTDDSRRIMAIPAWVLTWVSKHMANNLTFQIGIPHCDIADIPELAYDLWNPRSDSELASFKAAHAAATRAMSAPAQLAS